jgi:hypothetical protein
VGDACLNTLQYSWCPGRIIRPVQSIGERQFIGRPVALEHEAAQAQQSSAVVSAMIHTTFKRN